MIRESLPGGPSTQLPSAFLPDQTFHGGQIRHFNDFSRSSNSSLLDEKSGSNAWMRECVARLLLTTILNAKVEILPRELMADDSDAK